VMVVAYAERVVAGHVPIATYDYGGTGSDVVLLHGGARTGWVEQQLAAAERVTPRLRLISLPTGHDVHHDDPKAIIDIVSSYVAPVEGREQ
jgi:hypothetical protein